MQTLSFFNISFYFFLLFFRIGVNIDQPWTKFFSNLSTDIFDIFLRFDIEVKLFIFEIVDNHKLSIKKLWMSLQINSVILHMSDSDIEILFQNLYVANFLENWRYNQILSLIRLQDVTIRIFKKLSILVPSPLRKNLSNFLSLLFNRPVNENQIRVQSFPELLVRSWRTGFQST